MQVIKYYVVYLSLTIARYIAGINIEIILILCKINY